MAPGSGREQGYWHADCKLFHYTGNVEKVKLFFLFFAVCFCYFRRHGEFVEYYIYVTFLFFSLQPGKKRVY